MNKFNFINYKKNPNKIVYTFFGNLIFVYCIMIAIALMVFSYTTIECEVAGASMQPTLNKTHESKHDTVYINKYDKDYEYGDIVVISTTNDAIIKRIVGLSGDIVDFVKVNGVYKLERNGQIVDEDSYILINPILNS